MAVDLAVLRDNYLQTLNRTCTVPGLPRTVQTLDETSGVAGTTTETMSQSLTGVPCAFGVNAGNTPIVEGAQIEISPIAIRFPWDTPLRSGMTIRVDAGPNGEPARTFELVAPISSGLPIGQKWSAVEYPDTV